MSITINQTWLRSQSGCRSGRAQFRAYFPRGLVVTERNVARLLVLEPGAVSWGYNRLVNECRPDQIRRIAARVLLDVLPRVQGLTGAERDQLAAVGHAIRDAASPPGPVGVRYTDNRVTLAIMTIGRVLSEPDPDRRELVWQLDILLFYGLDNPWRAFGAADDERTQRVWLLTVALTRYLEDVNGTHD